MSLAPETLTLLSLSLTIILEIFAIGLPSVYLVKTRRFRASVLRMWLSLFIWSIWVCLVIPLMIFKFTGDKSVFARFPEMTGIVPIAFIGWLPSLVICGVIYGIHSAIIRFKSSSSKPDA